MVFVNFSSQDLQSEDWQSQKLQLYYNICLFLGNAMSASKRNASEQSISNCPKKCEHVLHDQIAAAQ